MDILGRFRCFVLVNLQGFFLRCFHLHIFIPLLCSLRLNLKGSKEVNALGFCLDDECWRSYEQKVLSLMHQGLNDRAKVIRVIWRNTPLGCNLEDV